MGFFCGYQYAIMKEDLTKREFIKGGDIIFLFTMQGRFFEIISEIKIMTNINLGGYDIFQLCPNF